MVHLDGVDVFEPMFDAFEFTDFRPLFRQLLLQVGDLVFEFALAGVGVVRWRRGRLQRRCACLEAFFQIIEIAFELIVSRLQPLGVGFSDLDIALRHSQLVGGQFARLQFARGRGEISLELLVLRQQPVDLFAIAGRRSGRCHRRGGRRRGAFHFGEH